MAKQTFLNLPDEKKEKIIKALKKEFSRASLKDSLVSNIIKQSIFKRLISI